MRTIKIDFTDSTGGTLGRAGEHNNTEVVFLLTPELAKCDLITAEIGTANGEKIPVEGKRDNENKTFTLLLTKQLTAEGVLALQLIGYVMQEGSDEPQIIAKSPVVSGVITPSINGIETETDSNPSLLHRIWAKIQAWADKIHTHDNKTILDGFTSFADNQFYNGLDKYDLRWKYGTLRFVGDGAVVKEIKEIERDGKKFLRLYLHWSNGVILEGQSDFIDIPVNAVTQIEEENPGFDFTLNGGVLELPTGGDGGTGSGGITVTDDGEGNVTIM